MEVVIVASDEAAATLVAGVVRRLIEREQSPVLGLATGSSPLGVYRELIAAHHRDGLSFAGATAFLLDEYVGLPPDHPEGYRSVIRREFVDHIDLQPDRLHGPDAWADDLAAACAAYDELIRAAGGIDVQLLGIGTDGHIGFNEPSSSLASRTRIKTLTAATRADNARFFDSPDAVPNHVITQGLGTIGDARHAVLLATGVSKAAAVAAAVEGPVTAMCPASVLQLHAHATVIVDEAAASTLRLAGYYRETYAGKPGWQLL